MLRRLLALFGLLAVLGYAGWLAWRFSPEPGGADASGYLHSAMLLAGGQLSTELHLNAELRTAWPHDFQPLGFEAYKHTTRLVPQYPVGLPLHFAAASLVFGLHWGAYLVEIGATLGTLLLCYLSARLLGISRAVAIAVAVSLASCAVFIYSAVQPLSDMVATFWCLAAVVLAIKARRGSLGWTAACGVAFSIAVLVRPSDVLLLPALVVALRNWKRLVIMVLVGLPVAVALGFYQNDLYGSPFRTGYSNVGALFSTGHFWPTMRHFAGWLLRLLPMGLLGLVATPLLWRERRQDVAVLLLWVGAFVGFYAFYEFSAQDWSFLRFIQPAFPALLILGGLGVEAVMGRIEEFNRRRGLPIVAALAIAVAVAANVSFRLPDARKHDRMYVEAREWVNHLPADALVVCQLFSGTVYFQCGHPILRWDIVAPADAPKYLSILRDAGVPVYAVLDASEVADPRIKALPGKWTKLAEFQSASGWKITPAENR